MPYYNDPIPYPGIHRIKLPLAGSPLKYVNAYLLPAAEGHLLIDTGWNTEDTYIELAQQLRTIGAHVADIKHIVITHAHVDHYGMAAKVVRLSNARLGIHAIEEKMVRLRYGDTRRYALESSLILKKSGAAERYLTPPQEMVDRFARLVEVAVPDTIYQGGEVFNQGGFQFEVILTPGHSPGHICLYDARHKIFFSGDHVLAGITPNIGLYPQSGPNPLDDYTASLQRLRKLDVELMLPAHGPPIKGFARRVNQILAHHAKRKEEILRILAKYRGEVTAFELVADMKWYSKGAPAAWESLRDFDKRLALSEVMAHLEAMAGDGQVAKYEREGIFYYQVAVGKG